MPRYRDEVKRALTKRALRTLARGGKHARTELFAGTSPEAKARGWQWEIIRRLLAQGLIECTGPNRRYYVYHAVDPDGVMYIADTEEALTGLIWPHTVVAVPEAPTVVPGYEQGALGVIRDAPPEEWPVLDGAAGGSDEPTTEEVLETLLRLMAATVEKLDALEFLLGKLTSRVDSLDLRTAESRELTKEGIEILRQLL